MLKAALIRLAFVFGKICSLFISHSIRFRLLPLWYKHFYTAQVKGEFKRFGKESVINGKFFDLQGADCVCVGSNTVLGRNMELTAVCKYRSQEFTPSIRIGNNCRIGANAKITAMNSIVIGDGVLTGRNVLITDNSHGTSSLQELAIPPSERSLHSKGRVKIDDNVWLGDNVAVLPEVHIGKGCIVGAGSVVTKDIPPYCVAAGIPAKVLKKCCVEDFDSNNTLKE